MEELRLTALDDEDLSVISAHLQDAVILIGDMKFTPARKQFALVANRFDWEHSENGRADGEPFLRRRTGLHFNQVTAARAQNIRQGENDAVLELLSITFEPAEAPSGTIALTFAGGGTLKLDVECIEAQMSDMGAVWETTNKPEHDLGDQA